MTDKSFTNIVSMSDKAISPAYDVCHAYRPGSEWVSQHALSINGNDLPMTSVCNQPCVTLSTRRC